MKECIHDIIFNDRIGVDDKWRCKWCYNIIDAGQDYSAPLPETVFRVKKSK
jgi:hypothetical protein